MYAESITVLVEAATQNQPPLLLLWNQLPLLLHHLLTLGRLRRKEAYPLQDIDPSRLLPLFIQISLLDECH